MKLEKANGWRLSNPEEIRRRKSQLRLSDEELARQMGLTNSSTVKRLLRGNSGRRSNLEAMLRVLGLGLVDDELDILLTDGALPLRQRIDMVVPKAVVSEGRYQPDDLFGRYRVLRHVGEGASGDVYEVFDIDDAFQKSLALKVLRKGIEFQTGFEEMEREAKHWKAACEPPHLNIVALISVSLPFKGRFGLVSEWIPHGTLAQWRKDLGGRVKLKEALVVMKGILQGLECLHEKQVIHRDVKPENILLYEKTPKLIDFGLARFVDTAATRHGIQGTPAYMAPEAIKAGVRTVETDLYSAGVVFIELLTGEIHGPGQFLPVGVPQKLQSFCRKAVAPEPERRFHSARAMREALEHVGKKNDTKRPTNNRGEVKTSEYPLLSAYKAELVPIPGFSTPFRMGRTPVTVGMWQEYAKAELGGTMPELPKYPVWEDGWESVLEHPIVNVSWEDCKAYADWAGLLLPTEAQWEFAASGGDGRVYPWGDTWDASKCRCSKKKWGDCGGTSAVGSFPAGPFGLVDMAGNVWEWCDGWYGDTQTYRPLRGGSWSYVDAGDFRCAYRSRDDPGGRIYDVGFRLSSPALR
nr:SUMF1/EgtB/PvdO family nonheme iron enzyme [Armatimonas sp.]